MSHRKKGSHYAAHGMITPIAESARHISGGRTLPHELGAHDSIIGNYHEVQRRKWR